MIVVDDEARFAADLYRGTAAYYDRYRLPYPEAMTGDLARRAGVSGRGRLLDLACGTGQLAFRCAAGSARCGRWMRAGHDGTGPGQGGRRGRRRHPGGHFESRDPPDGSWVLRAGVIGNAFHRLDRDLVAGRIAGWLEPGGHLALCWSSSPWAGPETGSVRCGPPGQVADSARRRGRVPAGWDLDRQRRPDAQVLSGAGFGPAARREFAVGHRWSLPELAGHIRSTSFLPAAVLGAQSAAFDAGLAAALAPFGDHGAFTETVSFAYELACKTASLTIADGGLAGGGTLAQCP